MRKIFWPLLLAVFSAAQAQSIYVPGGSVGSSANGNVGVGSGITAPTAALQVGSNIGNQGLKVGIVGNMGNANAEIRNSMVALGDSASSLSAVGATAWNYYNGGTSPSWAGSLLTFSGISYPGNIYGIPAAGQGSLLFQNTTSGVIATSGAPLYIAPNSTITMAFLSTGNVGIGTNTPKAKLDVQGQVVIDQKIFGGNAGLLIKGNSPTSNWPNLGFSVVNAAGNDIQAASVATQIINSNTGVEAMDLMLQTATAGVLGEKMRVTSTGNVGIGTANPLYKLSVAGTIQAKEVIVETTGWSDYVFAKGYCLQPLPLLEAQIQREGHLPNIPSADEAVTKGVNVGAMQAKLLAKLEELTLYVIDQNKRIEKLERENAQLREHTSN